MKKKSEIIYEKKEKAFMRKKLENISEQKKKTSEIISEKKIRNHSLVKSEIIF